MIHQNELRDGFEKLGVLPGDLVLVHSALTSLGKVQGGAEAVIDALLEVLGPKGTLMMPTLSTGVFDHANSPSKVGLLTEAFRQRPGVLRSFHPSHSVAALGDRAAEMTEGHLDCPTACGDGTPYAKLMENGGKILLLGVDQDRNTSFHGLEAMARLPYLKTITREYVDPCDGSIKSLEIREYPGPHRNFIGLDQRLRQGGAMRIGKVGRAVCRLIDARAMRDLILPELRHDPTLILCDNPSCHDCVMQRASVKGQRLKQEDFTLSVVSDAAGKTVGEICDALEAEGISHLELREIEGREVASYSDSELTQLQSVLNARRIGVTGLATRHEIDAKRLMEVAMRLGSPAVIVPLDRYTPAIGKEAAEAGIRVCLENTSEDSAVCLDRFRKIEETGVALAFHPANFAAAGEKPFLRVYSKTPLRRRVAQLRFSDGTFDGQATLPGRGNGEVLELLSILRCGSFDGPIVLDAVPGFSFSEVAKAFWDGLGRI